MGGGGTIQPDRPQEVLAVVPAAVDGTLAAGTGLTAAACCAPFILTIDRAITEAAAGRLGLFAALSGATADILRRPGTVLRSPALWMVVGVYGSTYAAANLLDTFSERAGATPAQHVTAKLVGTTAVNMTTSIAKDVAFARIFGKKSPGESGKQVAEVAKHTAPRSMYGLFVVRDLLTIGAGFTLPQMMAHAFVSQAAIDPQRAAAASQLVSPMFMQCVCTPLHLLALNMYNMPKATAGERAGAILQTLPQSTLTRMFRFLCAYGIGGILNSKLMHWQQDWSTDRYYQSKIDASARTRGEEPPPKQRPIRTVTLSPFVHRDYVHTWVAMMGMSKADIDRFFAMTDTNHDGLLDEQEVHRALDAAFGDDGLKHETARRMIAVADRAHDGKVSREELYALLSRAKEQKPGGK